MSHKVASASSQAPCTSPRIIHATMSPSDNAHSQHSDSNPQGSSPPKPFPKKRLRIPGIEDLVLPASTNHPEDAQPIRKKAKKNAPSPGIVYISRLPPGMTHQKVKHILAGYGEIGRIYAQQKDGEFFGQRLRVCCAVELTSHPQHLSQQPTTSRESINMSRPITPKHGSSSRTRRLQRS